jgi:hypothetical protein
VSIVIEVTTAAGLSRSICLSVTPGSRTRSASSTVTHPGPLAYSCPAQTAGFHRIIDLHSERRKAQRISFRQAPRPG